MQIVERLQCSSNTASGHNANSPREGGMISQLSFASVPFLPWPCFPPFPLSNENCLSLFYFVFFSFFEELPPPLRHRIRPISFPVDSLVVHASRRSFDLNGSRAESTYIGIIIETEPGELVSGEGRIVRILCVVLCPHRSFSSSKFFKLNCFCFLSLSLFSSTSRRKVLTEEKCCYPIQISHRVNRRENSSWRSVFVRGVQAWSYAGTISQW